MAHDSTPKGDHMNDRVTAIADRIKARAADAAERHPASTSRKKYETPTMTPTTEDYRIGHPENVDRAAHALIRVSRRPIDIDEATRRVTAYHTTGVAGHIRPLGGAPVLGAVWAALTTEPSR